MNVDHSRHRFLVPLVVAALLALHAAFALWAASGKGTTGDELQHLTAGYSFWHLHDYRLHPENGILPQRWAALPALFLSPPFPALAENPAWRTAEVQMIGHQFFYETGYDHFPLLLAARAMIVVFSVATGLLVFVWSRHLFGLAGGLLSLGLFAFSPHLLAHGALVTSDMCMTFFFLASCGAWWRQLHRPGAGAWMLSALTFALACAAKHSAVLLLPMMVLMATARAWHGSPLRLFGREFTTRRGQLGAAAVSVLGHGAVAALVIWACYGFRYEAFNPALPPAAHFIRPWEVLDLHIGAAGKLLRLLAAVHALPEAFLYGTAYVIETAQMRSAFLNGDYRTTGWVSFFPWAFLLKTTLPMLVATAALVALGAARWIRSSATLRRDLYAVAPLAVLFGVYWVFSLTSNLNIGHRHILPTYPVLFIAAGALTRGWRTARAATLVAGLLVGGQLLEAARAAPHFLAYFNALGGGPENGHRHLVDSSLDWGQDLPGLKTWLDAHAGEAPVYLSYFGTGEPNYHGIRAHRLPFVNGFKILQPYVALEPGWYCIGATMLQHVYSPVRGPWTLEHEREYQQLRQLEPAFLDYPRNAKRREELERQATPAQWRQLIARHDVLRMARLCHYLRLRRPEASVGHSIFIYRLTATELTAATAGSASTWRQLLESAGAAR